MQKTWIRHLAHNWVEVSSVKGLLVCLNCQLKWEVQRLGVDAPRCSPQYSLPNSGFKEE